MLVIKRILCVTILTLWAVGCSQSARAVRPELKGVYHAARAIEGALAVAVTIADFGVLIREMSKELLLARDRAKYATLAPDPDVQKFLVKYGELLDMYKDSAKVWQLQIEDKKYDNDLPGIAAKYGMSSAIGEWKDRRFGTTSTEKYVDYDRIRQAIWAKASTIQEEQTAEAYGRFIPATAQKAK